jgi:hypothetical protein
MGMYDTVMVKCPSCGKKNEFQSKGGDCLLSVYTLKICPDDVLSDVNRHAPYECRCGVSFMIDIPNRKAVVADKDPVMNNVIVPKIKIDDFYNKLFRTKGNNTDYKINKFNKENVKITWFETSSTLYSIDDALKYISNGEWILKP